jgi:chromosome segregation protein
MLEQLAAEVTRVEKARASARERQSQLRAALAETQGRIERLKARYELLGRLRAEGEGLRSGVQAILRTEPQDEALRTAGSRGLETEPDARTETPLRGIVGSVAQLLRVPEEYELAIEMALGERLQAVVVESWADAQAAIEYLKAGKRGRVTLLPLDTVRAPGRLPAGGLGASELATAPDEGLVGVAADLVKADERLNWAVEELLGRTFVVRDLSSARRTFERLRASGLGANSLAFRIVTLEGEILRSSGSVTGGQGEREVQGQVLAREREWRELPVLRASMEERFNEIEAALADAATLEARLVDDLTGLAGKKRDVEEQVSRLAADRRGLEREMGHIQQQIAWRQGLIDKLDAEGVELDATDSSLCAELQDLSSRKKTSDDRVVALQSELEALRGEALYQWLSEARTAAAVAHGAWEHRQTTLDSLEKRQAEVLRQIRDRRRHAAELEAEQEALADQIAKKASQEVVIAGWLASLAKKIEPAELEVARLETERERLEAQETSLHTHLRDAESRHGQAVLTLSRREDRLERLRNQITDDFGLVEMELTEGMPEQPPLPLGELVSALPVVKSLPRGLEEEIREIRAQLRRIGSVNPNAPEEYAEVLDRHAFLTAQAADLEEAAQGLRDVIAELDEVMSLEFQNTFDQVEARFRENFGQLFGGGSARLILTEPDDLSNTGVEISAQPPGRRPQPLALLSGGERSLTAVALIFALLEVSAPPFCVLDEVDAMLDEANVRRFRQALESLAKQTQFIVITHNRRTIEAADTIYGVSMGDDSVSQVVSLRLEGDRIAAPDGSTVDVAKDG